jgi:uncharacterized BrkB/YihY/UPF0761 family membrane protein
MSLPYSGTASRIVSILGLLVPITLGVIRGIFPQSGWVIHFAAVSGLAAWCSLHFALLINVWSQTLSGMNGAGGLGSNGAANSFASVFGWLPGVALFFVSLFVTFALFKWLPNKLKEANRPWDATGTTTR